MVEIENTGINKKRATAQVANKEGPHETEAPRPPSIQYLCLEQTLYSDILIDPHRDKDYITLIKFGFQQFDAHCTHCGKTATFRTFGDRVPADIKHAEYLAKFNAPTRDQLKRLIFEEGQFALHLRCSRNPNHLYSYFFTYDETKHKLKKIGQFPSLEDIAGSEIERYRKILGSDFTELRKATGLFAHGIGIGSFVYLRRVFEGLINHARSVADPTGQNSEKFAAMRMAERIEALSDHLPKAVVKHKQIYGILSKGVHELTEEECKEFFPAVRAAIIMMLEQRYEAAEKAKVEAELDRAIESISARAMNK